MTELQTLMMPAVTNAIKQVKWKLNTIKNYRSSQYFNVTPRFLFSEVVSKKKRDAHYTEYSSYIEKKNLSEMSEIEFRDIMDAKEFSYRHLSNIPDLGRFPLLDLAVSMANVPGLWLEFGVFQGKSINYISSRTANTVHGFDSFKGLPADWTRGLKKGHFSLENRGLPRVRKSVHLHVGLFSETLSSFKEEIGNSPIAFLHIDCDLYTSTKNVFDYLGGNIVPGTVIVFDELYNYLGWKEHEFKAFNEYVVEKGLKYRFIGFNSKAEQVALVVA